MRARQTEGAQTVKLAMFDLDGTLVESMRVDAECYVRSFDESFGIREIDTRWDHYDHATDSHIGTEILRRHLGREPTADEIDTHREAFYRHLRAAADDCPDVLLPVPGVNAALRHLREEAGWCTALATGGWRRTGVFKLERAAITHAFDGAAFADDDTTRAGIMKTARTRAESAAGEAAERLVYVGDAIWDVLTCRREAVPFLGIGRGDDAQRLRDEGAGFVLPDFRDVGALLEALASAKPPA